MNKLTTTLTAAKLPLFALIALSVAACTQPQDRLKVADYADAGTTALVIAQGGVEMNPVIGVAGNSAAPVVALVSKYALREGLPVVFPDMSQDNADTTMNAVGWLGACNNLMIMASSVTFPASLLGGAICAGLSVQHDLSKGETQ